MTSVPPGVAMVTPHLHTVGGTELQCARLAAELTRLGTAAFILTRGTSPRRRHSSLCGVPVEEPISWPSALKVSIMSRWGTARSRSQPESPYAASRSRGAAGHLRTALTSGVPTALDMRGFAAVLRRRDAEYAVIHLHGVFWPPVLELVAEFSTARTKRLVVKITNEAERTWSFLEKSPRALVALRRADAVITLSRSMQQYFQGRLPNARVELIPNGISLPALGQRGRRQDGPVIYVGTLKRQKGVDVLLRAWARLPAHAPSLRLVGDGPQRPALEALARELGLGDRVTFLGTRNDVPALLREASAFVLPSRWEGMPNALLEAMSFGLPCIATQIPGSADLIEHSVSGMLVPPEDPIALAAALEGLLTQPERAARLGERARAAVERSLSIRRVALRYQELYADLVRGRS